MGYNARVEAFRDAEYPMLDGTYSQLLFIPRRY